MMDGPEVDLDAALRRLLAEEGEGGGVRVFDDEDYAFVDKIMRTCTRDSYGVFAMIHPETNRMQYLLVGCRDNALAVLAEVMVRLNKNKKGY